MTGYAKRKARGYDRYGTWVNGVQMTPDKVAGRTLTYNARTREWKSY